MLSETDGKNLINLAKESIILSFENKKPDLSPYSKYSTPQGVFVTLHKNGELRGCIGYPTPYYPLNEAVVKAATAAAFEDSRFPPLEKSELPEISIELSVLTIPQRMIVKSKDECLKKIKIGEDGLIIQNDYTSGLLLPQVAPEWGWNEEEFLENTCIKACLPGNAWKDPDVQIYKFQAQIFQEKKND